MHPKAQPVRFIIATGTGQRSTSSQAALDYFRNKFNQYYQVTMSMLCARYSPRVGANSPIRVLTCDLIRQIITFSFDPF